MEKLMSVNTQRRNQAVNVFEKEFHRSLNIPFWGKTMGNICIRIKAEFIEKDEDERIVKHQSKLTFNWIQKSYTFCDSYTFKQNEVQMDKPN